MRSILLILCLTVCVSGLKLDLSKELSISNKMLALFKKVLGGIDLEQRVLKLRNLASRSIVAKLTKAQEKELKERIAIHVPITFSKTQQTFYFLKQACKWAKDLGPACEILGPEHTEEAKIKTTVIQKPPGVTANNIFEINEKSGIANFLYEGDMNLTEEQLNQLTKSVAGDSSVSGARAKRAGAALIAAPKWPNGIVYYYFDTSIATHQRKVDAINAGLQFLEAKTCIRFVYSNVTTHPNIIKVIDGVGCWADVGMKGDEQTVSLGDGCETIGTVAHEFSHALGFKHMQCRFDRDQHITVDESKVMRNYKHNFEMLTINESINYTPYEYGGMMQYPVDSYSATPDIMNSSSFTMIPTDINYVHTMGNNMISLYDVEGLNLRYNCSAKCPAATSAKCQNGGVPTPNNCTICNCPLGYAGALCDQMPPASGGCGGELNAISAWQAKSFKYGDNTTILRDQFTECHHWIKAPAGSIIQVCITNMTNPFCEYGCDVNGIEFKSKDQRITNPKICCEEFLHVLHTAELNPMPVIAHNRYGLTEFTIEYRYDSATLPATTQCPRRKKNKCCCNIL